MGSEKFPRQSSFALEEDTVADMSLTRRTSSLLSMRSGTATNILTEVKMKTKKALLEAEKMHGEFDINVSDLLAQLSLYCMMGGEYDEALPLLHRKLVIHEKFGPEESVGDTLQQLGTAYRHYSNFNLAAKHLEKALERREKLAGKTKSHKVAETLNSLALLFHIQGNAAVADDFHSRSLQCYYDCTDMEDSQSEDIPWEVFKRVQLESGPSMAQNSMTLLKGNIRMAIQQAILHQDQDSGASTTSTSGHHANEAVPTAQRLHRSLSDGSIPLHTDEFDLKPETVVPAKNKRVLKKHMSTIENHVAEDDVIDHVPLPTPLQPDETVHEPITSFPQLVERIEVVKRRTASGFGVEHEVNRLASDIALIAAGDLRQVGLSMLSLVKETIKLSSQLDQKQLPMLEGYLEKKSSSLFRGWERRWFKVDTRTLVMTYFHSKEDQMRGFAPRGTFGLSRITHIVTHQHLRGNRYTFDIVVDLSTRANPHASRTFELRCESEADLKYWVDTIEKYRTHSRRASNPNLQPPGSPNKRVL
ncbi:Aste57867_23662 [Aphanomyces stellatus]|uniref:Aste57867_23662 protein n=1 Tax=Aphanomyces stellatus TaxID=120398 RepID=A0A485LN92_9STRA|nr:hypothetical protein As57867_023590 [Aphanomyces stellatus]VFU00307.1 Aste57867_23662 [Aphanomyces stellatus]